MSLLWVLAVLLRERSKIAGIMGIGILIAVVIAFTRTPKYTSSFSFVPQVTQEPLAPGLAGLAGRFGIPLGTMSGQAQSPQFYADLLRTREILGPIAADSFRTSDDSAARVSLSKFLGVSGSSEGLVLENTMRTLRQRVITSSVATRTTGVVTVRVQSKSPTVSQALAERLLVGVNRFNLVTRQSQAAAERQFVEGRLQEAQASLRLAEDALQRFLQANRQFTNSPQLTFQRDRLERNVTLQQQLVTGLVQQYEDARIREVRDTPVITVIERPSRAVRPDPRGRTIILALGTCLAFFVAAGWVLTGDALDRRLKDEDDPAVTLFTREWRRLWTFSNPRSRP